MSIPKSAFLLGTLLGLTAAKQPAAITDDAAFGQVIAALRADNKNYDKFKEPVETPLIGKSFAVTMPLDAGGEGRGTAYYDYKDGKLILNVSPSKAWPLLAGPSEAMPVLNIADSTKMTGTYIGQNAFGVTAEVRNFRNTGSGIAIVSSPKGMPSPINVSIGSKFADNTDWWLTYDLPPSEAKAFGLNTVAVVQGTYSKLPNGKVGFCHSLGLSATIDSPSNYHTERCYIGASISRIAFVNQSTGSVIKEWTTASNPTLGPELWGGIREGMNKYQLKTAQPTITDYGSFEYNGLSARVEMLKNVASKVRVTAPGYSDEAVAAALNQRYGQPVSWRCIVQRLCSGKWHVSREVVAYLGIGGEVTYQLATDEPPIGFRN